MWSEQIAKRCSKFPFTRNCKIKTVCHFKICTPVQRQTLGLETRITRYNSMACGRRIDDQTLLALKYVSLSEITLWLLPLLLATELLLWGMSWNLWALASGTLYFYGTGIGLTYIHCQLLKRCVLILPWNWGGCQCLSSGLVVPTCFLILALGHSFPSCPEEARTVQLDIRPMCNWFYRDSPMQSCHTLLIRHPVAYLGTT